MTEQATNPSTTTATGKAPTGKRALNEFVRSDGAEGKPSFHIPDNVAKHYIKDGNAYKSAYREGKIEFVDRGNRMHAYHPISTFTVRAMSEIAESRGWKAIEVTGTDKFKQSAYIENESRGIKVGGYKPTQKDSEILQRREDRKAAQENPVVKAYLEAETVKAKTAAAKQYPELKEAFNETKKAEAVAANIDSKKAASNFIGRFKDSVAIALHTGKEIPKVAGVEAKQTKTVERPEPSQDQGRSR